MSSPEDLAATCEDAPPLLSAEQVAALRQPAQVEEIIRLHHALRRTNDRRTREAAVNLLQELALRYPSLNVPSSDFTLEHLLEKLQIARGILSGTGGDV